MVRFAEELNTKHEKKTGVRRGQSFWPLDEQIHCLLRFLLDSGVQGEVLVGDANLGVISK